MLSEASKVARSLEVLLRRADFDTSVCSELLKTLGGYEQSQLQKSYGRIESRKRFKGQVPQPLLAGRVTNYLYIDECGKSKREPLRGPTFFSLGAVAMSEEAASSYRVAADQLKTEFFGKTDMTFHEPQMRDFDGPFYFHNDKPKQTAFNDKLNDLIVNTSFVAFGVGIRKWAFEEEFVATGIDPYLPTDAYAVAIAMLLERYLDFLAHQDDSLLGRVTFESQGPKEDAEHQLEFARLLLDGTQWVAASAFRNRLETGLRFTPKRGSDAMELADMFARDLFEWIRGECTNSPARWDIFSEKIYCRGDGMRGTFGVKVFPDADIRDRIESHRFHCGAFRTN